jgi:hypothetical protein
LTASRVRAVTRAAHAQVHRLAALEHGGRRERPLVRGERGGRLLAIGQRRTVRGRLLRQVRGLWRHRGLAGRLPGGCLVLCRDLQGRGKHRPEQDHERERSSSSHSNPSIWKVDHAMARFNRVNGSFGSFRAAFVHQVRQVLLVRTWRT